MNFRTWGKPLQATGRSTSEAKKRVEAGWSEWRKVSGIIHDRRQAGKVYRMW